jgi:DNA-binding MarR family transcriptional regulator
MVKMEHQIEELTQRIGNRFIALDRKLVFQHGQLKLYASEIHLMQVVADYPGINATGMAQTLGITKGAVSQTLKRLEQKGAIYKQSDPYNKNELKVSFTGEGQEALNAFFKSNEKSWREYNAFLGEMTESEIATVAEFLRRLESFLGKIG